MPALIHLKSSWGQQPSVELIRNVKKIDNMNEHVCDHSAWHLDDLASSELAFLFSLILCLIELVTILLLTLLFQIPARGWLRQEQVGAFSNQTDPLRDQKGLQLVRQSLMLPHSFSVLSLSFPTVVGPLPASLSFICVLVGICQVCEADLAA